MTITQPQWTPEQLESKADEKPLTRPGLLPDEFWTARPVFAHIRQAAHSQACSADVLFYTTLCRLSGMLSHHVRAVTGIAGRASLNLFAAPVGASGTGKSTSSALARGLMASPDDEFRDGLPIGTGEGIAEVFMGTVDEETGEVQARGKNAGDPILRKVRKQVRHNAYFYVDEGQTLAQLAQRSGSTLAETIRRAAIGETLGQTNASEERTRYVAAGTYSMGLLIGFQPSTAAPLLADASTGTPQRFFWCWADDPTIPDEPTPWPGEIEAHPGHLRPDGPVDVTFPEGIRRALWLERTGRARGEIEVSELDGHAGLMKVKMAALFSLLDGGRLKVSQEDWDLAGMAWKASCQVRDTLVVRAQREAVAQRERDDEAKVLLEMRTHDAKTEADLALERVARLARKHASQVGGITYGALRTAIAHRDRKILDKAIDLAISREWIFEEGDRLCVKTD